ncbi:MAG TPA: helix-turn-helix domain-containing protein [Thermoanaerobaculia bacterium]
MIKNERQYRITKAHAEKFRDAIRRLESAPLADRPHPKIYQAELDAMRSQVSELEEQLRDYDSLRAGERLTLELNSFEDLPRALIQARIASGMSQEDLAERLNLKPQQIQRYEATDYRSASLTRLAEVIRALGISVPREIFLSGGDFSLERLLRRLKSAGLPRELVKRRLLTRPLGTPAELNDSKGEVMLEAVEAMSRIFSWSPSLLFGETLLSTIPGPASTARFRLPQRVRDAELRGYVFYAHYLALIVLQAIPMKAAREFPQDPEEVHDAVTRLYGELTFESTLKYMWTLGVAILPLNDPGTFYGACWRIQGRSVIVLKQRTQSTARWLHDLLHEYYHIACDPSLESEPVIEEGELSLARRDAVEEQAADQFAGDVVFRGRAEELTQQCVEVSQGKVERLKQAVPIVAVREGVDKGALANYMAYRLSLQGIDWWGTAHNLQKASGTTGCTPRDLVFRYADFSRLDVIDRDLLLRALEPLALGFAGLMGSGKSTISREVASALGWKLVSFGEYVRTLARSRGLPESREVLQELGASLVESDAEGFCRNVLVHFGWKAGEPLVLDGVRHVTVFEALHYLLVPLEIRLVLVSVDDEVRRSRLLQRDHVAVDQLAEMESHSSEREVNGDLASLASMSVSGNRPLSEVVREVTEWVHAGNGLNPLCST